jgi:RNA polymerase sigma-70 factor (ECF subfamily)
MDEPGNDTQQIQASLRQLQSTDEAVADQARHVIINLSSERLEKLARKMLNKFPRLRRWEQTGDVLQNALLRLHRSLLTIHPESIRQLYGLASTQIRRELLDLTRHHFGPEGDAAKHYTDGAHVGEPAAIERQQAPTAEPESLEEWAAFHEAVQNLPDAEREVFHLYWYEGLDQKSIADLLNVTDRTVKNRWRNAKLMLHNILSGNGNQIDVVRHAE